MYLLNNMFMILGPDEQSKRSQFKRVIESINDIYFLINATDDLYSQMSGALVHPFRTSDEIQGSVERLMEANPDAICLRYNTVDMFGVIYYGAESRVFSSPEDGFVIVDDEQIIFGDESTEEMFELEICDDDTLELSETDCQWLIPLSKVELNDNRGMTLVSMNISDQTLPVIFIMSDVDGHVSINICPPRVEEDDYDYFDNLAHPVTA